ncbi:hypothetical protein CHUAL_001837 [Chamberlinius hualienensis]
MAAKVLSVFILIILIIDGIQSVPTTDTSYELTTTPPEDQQFAADGLLLPECSKGEVYDKDRDRCIKLRTGLTN